jgi:hypothetical protein
LQQSSGFINDYMNDLVFHGLFENAEVEIVDWPEKIICLYKSYENQIPKQNLWGLGFSQTFLIDDDPINRQDIEYKIEHNYFDYVIFGAIRRYNEKYQYIKQFYNDNQIICIDGNDDCDIDYKYSEKHLYFKRELHQIDLPKNVIPIHFGIPESKILANKIEKSQDYGSIIPGQGGYKFNDEQSYYNDYAKSYFGVTMKKAGWDCLRHYEIIANNCLPYFVDIDKCPINTLNKNFKGLCKEAYNIVYNFNIQDYNNCIESMNKLLLSELTTKQVGKYILNQIK